MSTLHELAAERAYEYHMSDPDFVTMFQQFLGEVDDHVYDDILPALGIDQRARGNHAQMYAAWRVVTELAIGWITATCIYVGHPPAPDRERDVNRERLARLPHPFIAHVDTTQFYAEQDGTLEWTEPIQLGHWDIGEDGSPTWTYRTLEPGLGALEIGSTKASKTLHHVMLNAGGVARWPYGEERIHHLVRRRDAPRVHLSPA